MKVFMFSTHSYEKVYFKEAAEKYNQEINFFESRLSLETAALAKGFPCVCAFVNDDLNSHLIELLAAGGMKLLALRSAGFNHVDLYACSRFGVKVVYVPDYSPNAIAEHAVALILSLNRKIPRAHNRVRDGNFSLNDLVGFDLHNKTVGIIGTGKIGTVMAKIMLGFGCVVLAHDLIHNPMLSRIGVEYATLDKLLRESDIISLHLPLTEKTHHIINDSSLAKIKKGVMLINTGRGALIDTKSLIDNLLNENIGYAGLDVYEREKGIFFEDFSNKLIDDESLSKLRTFPNVIITSHQAFLTKEALFNIAETTLLNIERFDKGQSLLNEIFS